MIDFDKPVWNDRESLFINRPEVSGIYEGQSTTYQYPLPNSDYPILRMPYNIYDKEGDVLEHGMYMLMLDANRKYLMFVQSGMVKARVPVLKYSEKMVDEEARQEREDIYENYKKYMQRGRQRKAKTYLKELEIYDKRLQAQMKASITEDEISGFYVVQYETFTQKATAIIPIYK